jgi:hypothetical protein
MIKHPKEKRNMPRYMVQKLQFIFKVASIGWMVLLCIILGIRMIPAQNCQADKLQQKIADLEQERWPPIRLHRVEQLEDDVFVPIVGSKCLESPFFIYQIEDRRFYLEGNEFIQRIPAGEYSKYIAISRDGERVYRLAGFSDPEGDFKRLVIDYHLMFPQILDGGQSRALFCAKVVFGKEPAEWIFTENAAQKKISDFFGGNKKQIKGWWREFKRSHPRSNLNLTTTMTETGGFLTKLPIFLVHSESGSQPEIPELQIQVNRDGSCFKVDGQK